jgi:hypothetical protein
MDDSQIELILEGETLNLSALGISRAKKAEYSLSHCLGLDPVA